MAVIHVLDKHTAELIAAGEVVEHPLLRSCWKTPLMPVPRR